MQALTRAAPAAAVARPRAPPARRAAAFPPTAPRLRGAPLAAPRPRAPAPAPRALGLGAVGAGVSKVLGWLGISKGSAGAAAAAVTAAAGDAATKAAAMAAVKAALKFLWPVIAALLLAGALLGAAAAYLVGGGAAGGGGGRWGAVLSTVPRHAPPRCRCITRLGPPVPPPLPRRRQGVPQLVAEQVDRLRGKKLKLWTNPASRGQIVSCEPPRAPPPRRRLIAHTQARARLPLRAAPPPPAPPAPRPWERPSPPPPPLAAGYLQELGVEVEARDMDMKDKREHRGAEFLAVNPFGKLPAISDGDFNLVRASRGRRPPPSPPSPPRRPGREHMEGARTQPPPPRPPPPAPRAPRPPGKTAPSLRAARC